MIIKVLGLMDIFIGLVFWLFGIFGIFGFVADSFILLLGFYLLVKGIVFATGLSVTSFLDILSGIIVISAVSMNLHNFVVIIVSLFLLQKGIFSLMG